MLFEKKREPSCSYCRYGNAIGCGEIMCLKHGVVSDEHACRSFVYDPLKRVPPSHMLQTGEDFTKEDFEL